MTETTNNPIKGNALMIFVGKGTGDQKTWKAFMWAQNHGFNMNGETSDVTSKDHGIWKASELTAMGWELSSEYIFSSTYNYYALLNKMRKQENIEIAFGEAKDVQTRTTNNTLPSQNGQPWELDTTKPYCHGEVSITSLELTANNGENATFSASMTGAGALAVENADDYEI